MHAFGEVSRGGDAAHQQFCQAAQITAEALAGATRARQEALLVQIGKEQRMRLRTFDAKGKLTADSFALADPSFRFNDISDDDWEQRFSRWLDRTVDTHVTNLRRKLEPRNGRGYIITVHGLGYRLALSDDQ